MSKVYIYDTTLRDGAQGQGVNFSVEDMVKIVRRLDDFGIDYIEGGWPGSNPKYDELFARVKEMQLKHSKFAAFGCTRRPKFKAQDDPLLTKLIDSGAPVVTVFGKSWTLHVTDVFKISLEQNLEMIYDSVKFLVDNGRETIFDAEHFFDGYKADPKYALDCIYAAKEAGASSIALCETNGGAMPWEVVEAVDAAIKKCNIPIGIHSHNDTELAVSNSIQAVKAGAVQVQGTINGLGERCGNANLCSIIPILELKMGYKCLPEGQIQHLTNLSRYVDDICNRIPDESQPFVGVNAFAHKAGVHVDAMMKNSTTYEHLTPKLIGNERRILMSELAGKSSVVHLAAKYDVDLGRQSPEVKEVLDKIMMLENDGYSFEDAEASFELLLKKELKQYKKLFELVGFRVIVEKRGPSEETITEATLKISVEGKEAFTVAEGDGPVHALDNALRLALSKFFGKELAKIKLSDYKVRVINTKDGTAARVRTLIESRDQQDSWSTVGVSDNVIEASWEALADSVESGLLRQMKKK